MVIIYFLTLSLCATVAPTKTRSILKSFPGLGIELEIFMVIVYFLTHSLCAKAAPMKHGVFLKVFPGWV